jgi:hypothetical protein
MNTSSDARNPVERLAEEFLERNRHGEQPSLREYLERYPALADEIRELLPALLMIEDLGESSGATSGSLAGDGTAAVTTRLERLGDSPILWGFGDDAFPRYPPSEEMSLSIFALLAFAIICASTSSMVVGFSSSG